jgi:3-deoxy-7-phosphoheptulonate synthase
LTKAGRSAIFSTRGNPDCHVILRGGKRPNYDAASVDIAAAELEEAGLPPRLMIDFSHANSRKAHDRQAEVAEDVAGQVARGDTRIIGAMIESNLVAGRQDLLEDSASLVFGQSVTDACLGWDESVPLLRTLARAVRERREGARSAA